MAHYEIDLDINNLNEEEIKDCIDELLITTIKTLNEKGYITKACCQGHTTNKFKIGFGYEIFSYIMFNDFSTLKYLKKYKKVRLPKEWKINSIDSINAVSQGTTDEDLELKIIKVTKAIERWAKRLPTFEELKNI